MTTQAEVVLKHLKRYRTITSLQAIRGYGITRLSHVIYVLRRKGYNIVTIPTRVATRYGGTTVAKYRLK